MAKLVSTNKYGGDFKGKTYKLKKDIVIPAGTVFLPAPTLTKRHGNGHILADFGLTRDSSGSIEYYMEPEEMAKLLDWFEEVK